MSDEQGVQPRDGALPGLSLALPTTLGLLTTFVAIPAETGMLGRTADGLACHVHLPLEPRRSRYNTGADAFGALLIRRGPAGFEAELSWIPAAFPNQETGSSTGYRTMHLAAVVGSSLVFHQGSPFTESHGWGERSFLYAYDTAIREWRHLVLQDGVVARRRIQTPRAEVAGQGVGGSDLVIWGVGPRLELFNGTRNPFGDHDPDAAEQAARRDAAESRARMRRGEIEQLGLLHRAAGLRLPELEEIVVRFDARLSGRALQETFILDAIRLDDGVLVMMVRTFCNGPLIDALLVFEAGGRSLAIHWSGGRWTWRDGG